MTAQDLNTLKGFFRRLDGKGNVPSVSNYMDLLESFSLIGHTHTGLMPAAHGDTHLAAGSDPITWSSVLHSSLGGLSNDDHTQYLNSTRHDLASHILGTNVPHDDHGLLSGRGDDDHEQYVLATGIRHMTNLTVDNTSYLGNTAILGNSVIAQTDRLYLVGNNSGSVGSVQIGTPYTADGAGINFYYNYNSNYPVISIQSQGASWAVAPLSINVSGGNVGIGTSEPSTKLHVNGAFTSGFATVAGITSTDDLIVGSNILNVDVSGSRIGINGVADPQFQLDINGNLRASGWIVGKHAIQISDANLIAHFDGPQPYATNFLGDPTGHKGQIATVTGGVIYRPGKFGKAVQTAEATTNSCTNPSLEVDLTGWSEQYDSGNVLTLTRDTTQKYIGSACAKMVATSGNIGLSWSFPHFHAAGEVSWNNGQSATVSVWVWGTGRWIVCFEDSGQNAREYVELTLSSTPQRIIIPTTNSSGVNYGSANNHISFFPQTAGTMYADNVQYEAGRLFATPYCDGSMGVGHTWAGTAHLSASSRTTGYLEYDFKDIVLTSGSVSIWCNRDSSVSAGVQYSQFLSRTGTILRLFEAGTGYLAYQVGNTNEVFAGIPAPLNTWTHYVLTWDATTNAKLYRNGTLISTSPDAPGPVTLSKLILGYFMPYAYGSWNGLLDDFAVIERAISADEVRAIYESNAPIFAETSTWGFRTANTLAWADEEGLWAINKSGLATFGVSGVNGKTWGGLPLDAGDVLIGRDTNYLWWKEETATLLISGNGAGITSINGGNIQTGTISADKINVAYLSAINSNLGTIYTGELILGNQDWSNFNLGTFTGLRMFKSGLEGTLEGRNAGVVQATFNSLGKITAAAGKIVLDVNGLTITSTGETGIYSKWTNSDISSYPNHFAFANLQKTDAHSRAYGVFNIGYRAVPDAGAGYQSTLSFDMDSIHFVFQNNNTWTYNVAITNNAIGFFGTTPATKPTVTGSRGSNAALTSLLTALANYGLIVNSTS